MSVAVAGIFDRRLRALASFTEHWLERLGAERAEEFANTSGGIVDERPNGAQSVDSDQMDARGSSGLRSTLTSQGGLMAAGGDSEVDSSPGVQERERLRSKSRTLRIVGFVFASTILVSIISFVASSSSSRNQRYQIGSTEYSPGEMLWFMLVAGAVSVLAIFEGVKAFDDKIKSSQDASDQRVLIEKLAAEVDALKRSQQTDANQE